MIDNNTRHYRHGHFHKKKSLFESSLVPELPGLLVISESQMASEAAGLCPFSCGHCMPHRCSAEGADEASVVLKPKQIVGDGFETRL